MIKKIFLTILVGLTVLAVSNRLYAKGARVILALKNARQVTGELLSVRDSSLVISTLKDSDEKDWTTQTGGIVAVDDQEIQKVIIKGNSNIEKGMALGFLIGAGAGALIGSVSGGGWVPPGTMAVAGGIVFGGAGFVIGSIVGVASSTGDKEIEPLPNHDFPSLKPFARFPAEEPEYLKKIK